MLQGEFLKIPQTGDRGTVFCPAVSESLTTLDSHTHDGVNSKVISSKSVSKGEIDLSMANWVLDSGDYKQSVTLPSGYEFNKSMFKFIINSGSSLGREINPTIIKTGLNTFNVFVMTNTFDLKVVIA